MVYATYDDIAVMQRNQAFFSLVRFFESCLFLFVMAYFSGALVGLIFIPPGEVTAPNGALVRSAWYPIYLLVLILSLGSLARIVRLSVFTPLIIICVIWCGMSMLWSIDPGISLRRSIALLMTTLCGLALAARYNWNEMVQRIAFVFLFLAIISFLTVLVWPMKGITQDLHVGAWRGPWVEKNYLGGNMTKGLVACMCAFAMRPDRWWLWIPGGLMCFLLVVLSTSKTALLISVGSIGLFIAIRIFRRRPVLRIPLMYFSVMGLESIREKFVLGYGYGIYWEDELGPSYYVRAVLEWGVPTAHNGWIESWLSCGIVIIALFGLHYIFTLLLAINRMKRGGVETYWAILSTLMFLFFSMSESTILAQNDLTWVLFVATSAKLWSMERPYWRKRYT